MQLPRRKFLHLGGGAIALPALPRIASALDYPTRPVRMIVGFPAGSGPDIAGRLMSAWLSEHLGQQFIIENRPGATGNIGTELVVRAPPDGYTLLVIVSPNAINPTLYQNLNFNFVRDIAPVASFNGAPFLIVVTPSFPATTLPEFVAYAKANPGNITMASTGNGAASHVFGELFSMMANIKLAHVPYRSDYITDLIGGRVQVAFDPIAHSIAHVRTGALRALAVTTANRLDMLPEVPSAAEFISGYEASGWAGLGAPRDTPTAIIATLNEQINLELADPVMRARLADLGILPTPMTPTQFGKFIADETEKWARVIKFANIKPE